MVSKHIHLKPEAIDLRRKGISMTVIEKELGIPRSTLSSWFRSITLTQKQVGRLRKNSQGFRVSPRARIKAITWHNEQKQLRMEQAKEAAQQCLNQLNINNEMIELTLAMLYLGEGSKKSDTTSMGNSDPMILKFFLSTLKKIYQVDVAKIRCDLHLRADQGIKEIKNYWSKELDIPLENFKYAVLDKRTAGKKTFPEYKGVCVISLGNVAIQRRLKYIYALYCEKIIRESRAVSSSVRAPL